MRRASEIRIATRLYGRSGKGTFRFGNVVLYRANALTGELVGLDEVDDGIRQIHFNTVLIATLDERDYVIRE